MIAGIAFVGTVTATVSSWFVDRVQVSNHATSREIEELASEVAQLHALLARRTGPTPEQ
jgi:hypothetical protein